MSEALKRVIPCLDVDEGKVVKGVNFSNMRVMGEPVALAREYENQGADEVVFLDISATTSGRSTMLKVVESVACELSIPFSVGGGLRTFDDAKRFLDAGADRVAVNSAALSNPQLVTDITNHYGAQAVIVAIDYKRIDNKLMVCSHAGKRSSQYELIEWVNTMQEAGAGELLLTSIDHDGSGKGFDCETYRDMQSILRVPIIASGGAKCEQDFVDAIRAGADAGLAATMFHSGDYTIEQVKQVMKKNKIPTRRIV
jgi:imidazole glycerol-phosphate synthase subunit HisF